MRPPSVDALSRTLADTGLPHPLLVDVAREAIAASDPASARARAEAVARALLGPVVNATGVLLHTNLGRAPIAFSQPARYSNLEIDLATGRRGSRNRHAAGLLARACGAEAALVVNNCAAAVLLVLAALAKGAGVVVSRGELVEIGGGFRVPEVMEQSGARLVEVGTTNRTRLADYRRAIADEPEIALILKVHQSNYRIVGFTEDVPVAELARLGPPVVADLGSGLLDAGTPWLSGPPPGWLEGEPAARQTLADGAALVTFSGDKLLGGPQAGIVAGSRELVDRCGRHPLARAVRPGGLVLAALQETALAYLRREGDAIPFWRMATVPVKVLRQRAGAIGHGEVVDCESVPGGGAVPGLTIPSAGIALDGDLTAALRRCRPPVIARVHEGRTVLDLRTVDPDDDALLSRGLGPLPGG
jgi:L-seryl-tRNA(Ser) seleniumtransferase